MIYESIYDLPITNYQKVIEENDFNYLKKNDDKTDINLLKLWEDINYQLIDEFGVSRDYQLLFSKERELINMEIRLLDGDLSAETHIMILKQAIENIKERNKKKINETSIRQQHARTHRILSEWSGRDSRKLTTFEYHNDLKDYEAESRQRTEKDGVRMRKVGKYH